MKTTSFFIFLGLTITGLSARAAESKWDISKVDVSKLPPVADVQGVTYAKDIQPLFKASCIRCHGDQRPKAGLRLDSLEAVLKGGKDGKMVIPGDSKQSLLVAAAARISDKIAMPPKHKPGGPGGPGNPGGAPPGAPNGGPPPAGDQAGVGGPGGPGGPGGAGHHGPPAKPLTAEQVGLVRAWIDQGAQ